MYLGSVQDRVDEFESPSRRLSGRTNHQTRALPSYQHIFRALECIGCKTGDSRRSRKVLLDPHGDENDDARTQNVRRGRKIAAAALIFARVLENKQQPILTSAGS